MAPPERAARLAGFVLFPEYQNVQLVALRQVIDYRSEPQCVASSAYWPRHLGQHQQQSRLRSAVHFCLPGFTEAGNRLVRHHLARSARPRRLRRKFEAFIYMLTRGKHQLPPKAGPTRLRRKFEAFIYMLTRANINSLRRRAQRVCGESSRPSSVCPPAAGLSGNTGVSTRRLVPKRGRVTALISQAREMRSHECLANEHLASAHFPLPAAHALRIDSELQLPMNPTLSRRYPLIHISLPREHLRFELLTYEPAHLPQRGLDLEHQVLIANLQNPLPKL